MDALPPLSFLAPLLVLAAALFASIRPAAHPGRVPRYAEGAALSALILAGAGVVQLLLLGPLTLSFGGGVWLLALRLDAVSATMSLLVAFVGWVVVRYSRTYLDGEVREGAFHGLMLGTLAAVMVLVQSGSLAVLIAAFLSLGIGMRKLLLFFADRAEAQRAAAKFTLVWGAGDAILIVAAVLLWVAFGTADLAAISDAAGAGLPATAQIAVALLVIVAALKTASFPLHGWLTEVMEAPTPVSALLHAGIINAGGFLMIRMAGLVQESTGAMAALVMLGGLTALFGAVVMLTQSAVKTALAWSTVAQMGFMLLQCGLGLWALVLYAAVALGFGLIAGPKSAQAVALGAILIFGVAYLVAQGLADAAPRALTQRTTVAALAAALAYFAFQVIAEALWGPHLPDPPAPGPLEWALIVVALLSFGLVAVAQALFPHWAHHPAAAGLRVHLANGLYLNAILDRLTGGFRWNTSS